MLTLKGELRAKTDKPANIRQKGLIPAVFYGKKEASTPIAIKLKDFLKVWKEAGESSVVTLDTETGNKEALIQDVDLDPVTGNPRHADFYVFEKGHKVEVAIPIEFIGVSAAIKDLGGSLVKVIHEMKIEAQPADLPHRIEVDIAPLANFGDQILAKDVSLPNGVESKLNPEEVVATVAAPREEKEEEVAAAAPDLSAVEISEERGKKEEASEAAAPEAEKKAE